MTAKLVFKNFENKIYSQGEEIRKVPKNVTYYLNNLCTKKRDDGVKNSPILRDVIYGRPHMLVDKLIGWLKLESHLGRDSMKRSWWQKNSILDFLWKKILADIKDIDSIPFLSFERLTLWERSEKRFCNRTNFGENKLEAAILFRYY